MNESKIKILEQFLPSQAAPIIANWIDKYKCEFKISRKRSSKFGDYRPPQRGHGHKISVNYNLNPYAFLITTVHEFAHLITFNDYKNFVKPHGNEWKKNFNSLMQPFFKLDIFPNDIRKHLEIYLLNPAASSCSDINLFSTLNHYNNVTSSSITVESIAINGMFIFQNKRIFLRLEKLRKRIKCKELSTGKLYLFNPLAEVKPYQF